MAQFKAKQYQIGTPIPSKPLTMRFKATSQTGNPMDQLLKAVQTANLTPEQQALLTPALKNVEEMLQQQNQFIEQLQDQIETLMSRPSAEDIERKRSLVFIGLPEPQKVAENAQHTDSNEPQIQKERKPSDLVALDKAQVRNILDSLNITAEATSVYRLGKETMQNGEKRKHPRLVKVILPASGYQRATLAAFSKNRAQVRSLPGLASLLIRPSLTPEEREKERELQMDLKIRRQQQPDKKWKIYRNQIVENQVNFS